MEMILTESFALSAGECNAEGEMALPILVARLIDIATVHANSLGIGNPAMTSIHAGWVLSRLTVDMRAYPMANERYSISTWIESFNRHFSERAFRIESADGGILGYARSVWMVMDTQERTNVGLSHLSLPDGMIAGIKPPIEKQARHIPIITSDEHKESESQHLVATVPVFDYCFKYSDIDFYRHVNTVRYVELILNRFTLKQHDEAMVSRLELSFLHEARCGEDVQLLRCDGAYGTPVSFLFRRSSDKTPLLFSRILFRSRHIG